MTLLLEDKLYLAPTENPGKKVLDIGTGTGLWAMYAAALASSLLVHDQHPNADQGSLYRQLLFHECTIIRSAAKSESPGEENP